MLTAIIDNASAHEGCRHGVFADTARDTLVPADVNKNVLLEIAVLADYFYRKVPEYPFEEL